MSRTVSDMMLLKEGKSPTPVTDQPRKVDATPPGMQVFQQALQQYPILRSSGVQGVYTDTPGKYGNIESWSPGEEGSPGYLRPDTLPKDKFGVQIFQGSVRPIDVLADAVSHHLVNVDPVLKASYSKFKLSLTQEQQLRLKRDYEFAKTKEGETRPFEQWRDVSRLPAYYRGYTFDQWPKEFTSQVFTKDQLQNFDRAREYLGISRGVGK
jgi:hypothetical protein